MANESGQIIATVQTPVSIYALSGVASAAAQMVVVEWLENNKKRSATGYVTKTELDAYNLSSVSIPANFAGLEAVAVPTRLQYQFFVITEVEEEDDGVTVTAQHVFYELLNNSTAWEATADTDYTCAAACRNIMTNAISPESRFSVASDCTDTMKGKELNYTRKNIVQAFLDPENGICKKFGLSLIRDNWFFYCLKEVGYDRGFVVEDGKNLLGVTRSVSIDNTYTRIAPIAKTSNGGIIWLDYDDKKYIDSQHVDNYSSPRLYVYDTGLQIGKDGVTSDNVQEKMLEAAQKLFTDEHIDDPEITMTVDFLSIGDTEEYAQYRGLDKVYLYDIITIKDKKRGYNYSAQVIGVEHDILTGRLNSVKIGNKKINTYARKLASWQVPTIGSDKIGDNSVDTIQLKEGAVTSDKLSDDDIEEIKEKVGVTPVVDSLVSTSSTSALSARQGKVLNTKKAEYSESNGYTLLEGETSNVTYKIGIDPTNNKMLLQIGNTSHYYDLTPST